MGRLPEIEKLNRRQFLRLATGAALAPALASTVQAIEKLLPPAAPWARWEVLRQGPPGSPTLSYIPQFHPLHTNDHAPHIIDSQRQVFKVVQYLYQYYHYRTVIAEGLSTEVDHNLAPGERFTDRHNYAPFQLEATYRQHLDTRGGDAPTLENEAQHASQQAWNIYYELHRWGLAQPEEQTPALFFFLNLFLLQQVLVHFSDAPAQITDRLDKTFQSLLSRRPEPELSIKLHRLMFYAKQELRISLQQRSQHKLTLAYQAATQKKSPVVIIEGAAHYPIYKDLAQHATEDFTLRVCLPQLTPAQLTYLRQQLRSLDEVRRLLRRLNREGAFLPEAELEELLTIPFTCLETEEDSLRRTLGE